MSPKLFLVGCLVLAGCQSKPTPATAPTIVILQVPNSPAGQDVILCRTILDLYDLATRIKYRDYPGIAEMEGAGRIIVTGKCEARITLQENDALRIRVTTGPYSGQEFWIWEGWAKVK